MNKTLFPEAEIQKETHKPMPCGAPRVQRPNRSQLELRPFDLESLLEPEHRARSVWDFVAGMDLSRIYDTILAVEGHAGRSAVDPALTLDHIFDSAH